MKTPLTAIGALWFLSLAGPVSAQTPALAPPPFNMGLWREEVTTTITGIDGVSPTPQKDVERFCISLDSWRKYGLQAANSNRCTVSNLHQDTHGVSYNESCSSQQNTAMVFHINILIDDDRHMHGTAVADVTAPNSPHPAKWASTVTERYIGPNCGDIKPGEKKPLYH
jgi:hypothetical protein